MKKLLLLMTALWVVTSVFAQKNQPIDWFAEDKDSLKSQISRPLEICFLSGGTVFFFEDGWMPITFSYPRVMLRGRSEKGLFFEGTGTFFEESAKQDSSRQIGLQGAELHLGWQFGKRVTRFSISAGAGFYSLNRYANYTLNYQNVKIRASDVYWVPSASMELGFYFSRVSLGLSTNGQFFKLPSIMNIQNNTNMTTLEKNFLWRLSGLLKLGYRFR